MEIVKIHNNNVVTSLDSEGNEIVVMGRGIAFQKKCTDLLEEGRIEKIFTLTDKSVVSKLEELIKNIPSQYLSITEDIVQLAQEKLNTELNENIYLTLTDHISYAVERIQKGFVIRNPMIWDIKCFYKDEFEVACKALEIIKDVLQVDLPEDEAAFITLHIVNAAINVEAYDSLNVTKFIGEILDIIKSFYDTEMDEEAIYYYRLITHLKLFAQRMFTTDEVSNGDKFLYKAAKKNYPESYACVKEIRNFVRDKYGKDIGKEEMAYLILNIKFIDDKIADKN
ncbi:MAG: PRD domain-containing protein [Anaerolineaceae bacterium]|nr:PRD domain-containing protein [Anaerolineaceae bacterium]